MKRRTGEEVLGRIRDFEVDGRRPKGRPKKTWRASVQEDLARLNQLESEVYDRSR